MALLLVSSLLHLYVGARLVPALAGTPVAATLLTAVLVASAIAMPLAFQARRRASRSGTPVLLWAGLLFMGLFSSLFVLTVLRDAALLVVLAVSAIAPGVVTMHPVVAWTAAAVPLLAAFATLWGLRNARRTATVVSVDIPIAGLPAALHGFTIAQISDIHLGGTIRRGYMQAIVDAVNDVDADMVAVTGDLVDGTVSQLTHDVAPLSGLSSRHGTFFVTGNHEYYSGVHAWMVELKRLGVKVLMNEHVVLQHGAASLVLAGVADYGAHHYDPSHRSDPGVAMAGAPRDAGVRVLLAHQPRSAAAAAQAGFDLQLSGHTHGGQFLPWNFLVRLQQPFTAGLDRLHNLWVYTSRGTGYWGPPKRFGAPSEITRLRLICAQP